MLSKEDPYEILKGKAGSNTPALIVNDGLNANFSAD